MFNISTSVNGRQKLLSDLYFRNYLMPKYFTIVVNIDDVENQEPVMSINHEPLTEVTQDEIVQFLEKQLQYTTTPI